MLTVVRILTLVLTGILGVLAALTDSRTSDGRMTAAGRLLLLCVIATTALSVLLAYRDDAEARAREAAALKRFADTISRHEQTLKTLETLLARQAVASSLTAENLKRADAIASGVDDTLLSTHELNREIESSSVVLAAASKDVRRLLYPLRVAALEYELEYSLDEPRFADFVDAALRYAHRANRHIREGGKPYAYFNRSYGAFRGLRIFPSSPLFPQGSVRGPLDPLQVAFLSIALYERPHPPSLLEAPADLLIQSTFITNEDLIAPEERGAQKGSMELVVDVECPAIVQHVIDRSPKTIMNTARVLSLGDVANGGIRVIFVKLDGAPEIPRLRSLRIYLDEDRVTYYEFNGALFSKDPVYPNSVWLRPSASQLEPKTQTSLNLPR